MTPKQRCFESPMDFNRISDFLTRHYLPGNRDGNWLQPVWEYAYTHPYFDENAQNRIGIWEDEGEIVGVTTYELRLGEAWFFTAPAYAHLKPEMLAYAEQTLTAKDEEGKRTLKAYVNDFDTALEQIVVARGYRTDNDSKRPMSQFVIPSPFPPMHLPPGFRVKSLAEENDIIKMHRVLYRGFNHPGEPPQDGLEGRKKMQSGPNFRADLTAVVQAPTGEFVAYCGMWYDAVNSYGYVEPVATDPDYRRRGLGSAAVLDAIRRCAEQGATVVYVGTDLHIYISLGFKTLYTENCWVKRFDT